MYFKDGWDKFHDKVNDNIKKYIYSGVSHHLMTLGDRQASKVARNDLKFRKKQYEKNKTEDNLNEIYDSITRLYDILFFNGELEDALGLTEDVISIKKRG